MSNQHGGNSHPSRNLHWSYFYVIFRPLNRNATAHVICLAEISQHAMTTLSSARTKIMIRFSTQGERWANTSLTAFFRPELFQIFHLVIAVIMFELVSAKQSCAQVVSVRVISWCAAAHTHRLANNEINVPVGLVVVMWLICYQ